MKTVISAFVLTFLCNLHADFVSAETEVDIETAFYQAIGDGDTDTILALLHPAARTQVDRPVLDAWAKAARSKLGLHVSTKRISSSSAKKLTGLQKDLRSEISFQHDTATASIGILDGKLIAFNVQSDSLRDWFQGPTDIGPYQATGREFIEAFLHRDVTKVRSLTHEALNEAVSREKMESMIATISDNGGAMKSLNLRTHRFSLEGPSPALFLTFDLECEKARGTCELEFQFVGMKGFLLGFDFR